MITTGIENRLVAQKSGVRVPVGTRDISLLLNFQTVSETHPVSYYVYRKFFTTGKATGCEVHHSLQLSAEVKNEWSYDPTPFSAFMAWAGTNSLLLYMESQSMTKVRGAFSCSEKAPKIHLYDLKNQGNTARSRESYKLSIFPTFKKTVHEYSIRNVT